MKKVKGRNGGTIVVAEKGESGNPSGRPVGSRNVSTALKEMLEQIAPNSVINKDFIKTYCKGRKNITIADAIAARAINETLENAESWAFKEVVDRTEGKAHQSIVVTEEKDEKLEAVKSMIQTKADEKGITFKQECQNYLENYAAPEFREKLVSELEQ